MPQNTAKHITTKIKLLNKKPLSLEETDSIFLGDFKTFIRENIKPNEVARIIKTNDKNTGPREDSVKECTELITPERVKKVPKIQRLNVKMISTIFHTRSMSFFS